MPPPFLSVVIPAYNEEPRIGATLQTVLDFLSTRPYTWEVVVANDGSGDATPEIVAEFAAQRPQVRLLNVPHRGKGWAVKNGMLAAQGEYRFLCDADLSMPIEQVERFLPPNLPGIAIGVGSREAPGSRRIGEPPRRHFMGRFYNLLVQLLAVPGAQDTQCGFKMFTREAAESLFPLQTLDGFSFDVELLYVARRRGFKFQEVAIDWHYRPASKVRVLRDSLKMSRDLLVIRWRKCRGRYGEIAPRRHS